MHCFIGNQFNRWDQPLMDASLNIYTRFIKIQQMETTTCLIWKQIHILEFDCRIQVVDVLLDKDNKARK
jgi:hypothetical protein